MPDARGTVDQRREARYGKRWGFHIPILVEPLPGGRREPIPGEVVDVSRNGAKVVINDLVPSEETISLRLMISELAINELIVAAVRWTRAVDFGKWHMGCAFEVPLPDSLLTRLTSDGYLEIRREPRSELNLPGTVRGTAGDESMPIRLRDASSGGVRFVGAMACNLGEAVLLDVELPDGQSCCFGLNVIWQIQREDGYHVGGSFTPEETPPAIIEVLRRSHERGRPKAMPIPAEVCPDPTTCGPLPDEATVAVDTA